MSKEKIQQEFDAFFEFPEGSSKTHITSTSAKLFAEHVARKLEEKIVAQQARIEQLKVALEFCSNRNHIEYLSGKRDWIADRAALDERGFRREGEDSSGGETFVEYGGVADKAISTPDDLTALRAHDEKLLAPYQWQPIETAPKDDTVIIAKLCSSSALITARFRNGNWVVAWDLYVLSEWDGPTHWMPLPSAAAIEKGGE